VRKCKIGRVEIITLQEALSTGNFGYRVLNWVRDASQRQKIRIADWQSISLSRVGKTHCALELQCLHMGLHVLQRLQFRNVGTVAELLAKRQHED
jgi:hypothetical protein